MNKNDSSNCWLITKIFLFSLILFVRSNRIKIGFKSCAAFYKCPHEGDKVTTNSHNDLWTNIWQNIFTIFITCVIHVEFTLHYKDKNDKDVTAAFTATAVHFYFIITAFIVHLFGLYVNLFFHKGAIKTLQMPRHCKWSSHTKLVYTTEVNKHTSCLFNVQLDNKIIRWSE